MNKTNPYYPDKNLYEADYKKNYYKYAAVVNVDNVSYLIDGCLVKLRGWELAIYPLNKKHTDCTLESIFLFPAKDKEALSEAFYLVRDFLLDNKRRDIKSCLDELDENPRLTELCSLPC